MISPETSQMIAAADIKIVGARQSSNTDVQANYLYRAYEALLCAGFDAETALLCVERAFETKRSIFALMKVDCNEGV